VTDQDAHWSDQPAAVVRPPSPLGVVAQRASEVSPTWANVTSAPENATDPLPPIPGRDRAIGVEAIREGWLLHRDSSRIVHGASPDLALLMGDWCYAAGLCTIADHGSLDDVARLATLVADVSARADQTVDELEPYWQRTLEAMRNG
jgi:hypothetical protein